MKRQERAGAGAGNGNRFAAQPLARVRAVRSLRVSIEFPRNDHGPVVVAEARAVRQQNVFVRHVRIRMKTERGDFILPRFGVAVQRTKVYHTAFDIQRGFFAGFSYQRADVAAYVFNPDESPTVVLALSVGF